MKFYIVRHGQTLFNVKKQIQCWCDSPLTNLGIQQVQDCAKRLKDIEFAAGYSSTQERAKDTLDIILEGRDIPKYRLKGLKEIFAGDLEGEDESLYETQHIDFFKGFKEYNGESMNEAVFRFIRTLQEISSSYKDENVLIATHGGVMMGTLIYLGHQDYLQTHHGLKNCSVIEMEMKNGQMKLLSIQQPED